MIALLWAGIAWADPVALRTPIPGLGAAVGLHELSAAAPLPRAWWIVAEVRTSGSAVGASAGRRWILARGEKGWGVDATVAAGLMVLTTEPGVAFTTTLDLHGGYWGESFVFTGGLALPLAAGWVGEGQARIPGVLELRLGGRIGGVWVGAHLGMGGIWTPGLDFSTYLEPALWLCWTGLSATEEDR